MFRERLRNDWYELPESEFKLRFRFSKENARQGVNMLN